MEIYKSILCNNSIKKPSCPIVFRTLNSKHDPMGRLRKLSRAPRIGKTINNIISKQECYIL